MWHFLWRPKWILSHLFVLLLVVTMVSLGLWQLRRLDERKQLNRLVAAHLHAAPVPIQDLGDLTNERFTRVSVEGTVEAEVLINNRSLQGSAGAWPAVEVALPDGQHVLVSRGFNADGVALTPAPKRVQVEGFLIPRSRLDSSARVDLDPFFSNDRVLQGLVQQTSPAPALPLLAVPPPTLDEGPHLSYAVQWFIFSTIAVLGYPLILRRTARHEREEAEGAAADDIDRELRELLGADG
jgi:cytochrome oxidase assembly protein ShyY1